MRKKKRASEQEGNYSGPLAQQKQFVFLKKLDAPRIDRNIVRFTPEMVAVIEKEESQRTADEQHIFDRIISIIDEDRDKLLSQLSGIPSFLNPSDFGTFWPFDRRIRWAKGQLGMARPHQR
jgi:hypothetical protein